MREGARFREEYKKRKIVFNADPKRRVRFISAGKRAAGFLSFNRIEQIEPTSDDTGWK